MKLNFKRQPKAPKNVPFEAYMELVDFVNGIVINHNDLASDFMELRDEIATNGVVRDLRKLEREFRELRQHTATMVTEHDRQLEELGRNGVATAINKLNQEVFKDKKSSKFGFIEMLAGVEPSNDVTLAGKVDAIIEHLGLDISVTRREVVEPKVEVKKKPAPKKKGRK